jgi:hypothetical protein
VEAGREHVYWLDEGFAMTRFDEAKYHETRHNETRHEGEAQAKTPAHELTAFELELVAGGQMKSCGPCWGHPVLGKR